MTGFEAGADRTAIAIGLLIQLRHPGRFARVIALLDRLRLRFALAIGHRSCGATQDRSTYGSGARIPCDHGADDRSSHGTRDSVAARRRSRLYPHALAR
jgi:hypothetical protein